MRLTSVAVITGFAAIVTAMHDTGSSPILPPAIVIRHDNLDDAKCSEPPKLCTGAAMLDGASTTLTYVCPEKTAPSTTTVHVTVTKTETVPGEMSTGITGPSKGPLSEPAEPTTTTTLHSTTTSTKTLTVSRKKTTRSAPYTSSSSLSTSMPMISSSVSIISASLLPHTITSTSSIIFLPPSPSAPFHNTTTTTTTSYNWTHPNSTTTTNPSSQNHTTSKFPIPAPTPNLHDPTFPNTTARVPTHATEPSPTDGHAPIQTANFFARQVNTTSSLAHPTPTGEHMTPTASGNATLHGAAAAAATRSVLGFEMGCISLAAILGIIFL